MLTVQQLITTLNDFWARQGCALHQGYDLETGAGTFNPATFFRVLGKEPYQAAYVEPSRRPSDGRYGENPNRTQLFHQYQVIIKPAPFNIQQIYLQSLEALGFNLKQHDIRFVHDDWEQPSLGAWGLGWEVWRDGVEVSEFTYFQSVAGVELDPISVELTYGIERLALTLQEVDSFWELKWNDTLTYRDIFHPSEVEWSRYNFEAANPAMWGAHFVDFEKEAKRLIELGLPIPAYDFVMKASHAFNLLDARGVISVSERTGYITRLRTLAHEVALGYLQGREKLNFPLLARTWPREQRELLPQEPLPPSDLSEAEDFLLEIGSEELPATFVPIGLNSLHKQLTTLLNQLGLAHEGIETYGTPRRLAAIVRKLAKGKQAETSMRRGPKVEAAYPSGPSSIATGFFRSLGRDVPSLTEIEKGQVEGVSIKDNYLYVTTTTPAQKSSELLTKHLPSLILKIDFPKRMRWAEAGITYARPLHWMVALHGPYVIPFELGSLHSGRRSSAHAQLCPGTFSIAHASDYLETLRQHKVLASVDERQTTILAQLQEITALYPNDLKNWDLERVKAPGFDDPNQPNITNIEQVGIVEPRELSRSSKTNSSGHLGIQPLALDELLPELLYLTEWPQLTVAQFDPKFLEVPQEVLISEMVQHQRDIPLADAQGRLTNSYVITADNTPTDEIRRGNTKVLSARLSDGRFLYNQDLKQPLEAFNEKLKTITYIQALGTLFAKAQRVVFNTAILHSHLPLVDL
ncbi:MAG: glycine--tRNA ligase subunit alpha, partial [Verrucomicrobia bacterium]|nr:glycine--tRNA ligase subunit alpha [Verrucomicrobiota bacterium]